MKLNELNITETQIKDLLQALRNGTPIEYACDLAMIDISTYYKWKKAYEDYSNLLGENLVDGSKLEVKYDKNGELVIPSLNNISIFKIIKSYRCKYMNELMELLKTERDWQKYAWLLERMYRDVFGKEIAIDTSKNKVESIKVIYTDSKGNESQERLAKLEQEVKESINVR